MKNFGFLLSLTLFLAIGIVFGYISGSGNKNIKTCESKYEFINKDYFCLSKPIIEKHEYGALKTQLESYINQAIREGKINLASVYFRDLYVGPTLGINEHEKFIPASLLKVPVMIAYLTLAEEDKNILSKRLVANIEKENLVQNIKPKKTIEEGKPYSIDELIENMIIFSDNRAYDVLVTYANQKYSSEKFKEVFAELGIIDPKDILDQTITVKSYASIFRQLFNSSYLSAEMSEKALNILSRTEFNEGMGAGLPEGIKTANKFGERKIEENEENMEIQFHDCGIIYYPDNPYLLCIMTRGENIQKSIDTIKNISRMVYEEFNSRKIE